jgi:anti-sigma regulatory factor (Ser/Thr protein kinase)
MSAAASRARAVVRERFGEEFSPGELSDVCLVVSELVTNALAHGEGTIQVRFTVDRHTIRGEVIDEGSGFEGEVRERGVEEVGGRGLSHVGAMSQSWGVNDGSSHVWFEISRHVRDDEPTDPELGYEQRPDELN